MAPRPDDSSISLSTWTYTWAFSRKRAPETDRSDPYIYMDEALLVYIEHAWEIWPTIKGQISMNGSRCPQRSAWWRILASPAHGYLPKSQVERGLSSLPHRPRSHNSSTNGTPCYLCTACKWCLSCHPPLKSNNHGPFIRCSLRLRSNYLPRRALVGSRWCAALTRNANCKGSEVERLGAVGGGKMS